MLFLGRPLELGDHVNARARVREVSLHVRLERTQYAYRQTGTGERVPLDHLRWQPFRFQLIQEILELESTI